jgi:hypothetical protein
MVEILPYYRFRIVGPRANALTHNYSDHENEVGNDKQPIRGLLMMSQAAHTYRILLPQPLGLFVHKLQGEWVPSVVPRGSPLAGTPGFPC